MICQSVLNVNVGNNKRRYGVSLTPYLLFSILNYNYTLIPSTGKFPYLVYTTPVNLSLIT